MLPICKMYRICPSCRKSKKKKKTLKNFSVILWSFSLFFFKFYDKTRYSCWNKNESFLIGLVFKYFIKANFFSRLH